MLRVFFEMFPLGRPPQFSPSCLQCYWDQSMLRHPPQSPGSSLCPTTRRDTRRRMPRESAGQSPHRAKGIRSRAHSRTDFSARSRPQTPAKLIRLSPVPRNGLSRACQMGCPCRQGTNHFLSEQEHRPLRTAGKFLYAVFAPVNRI